MPVTGRRCGPANHAERDVYPETGQVNVRFDQKHAFEPYTANDGSVLIPLKNSVLESIESELGLITGSFSLLVATIGAR